MGRPKRSSKALENASKRLAGMKSISADLDLGNGLTMSVFNEKSNDVQRKMEAYNTALSVVDAASNELSAAEKELADFSERMLAGVAAKYGKNSHEYEMAGGVRKSEIKHPPRKSTPAAKA